MKNFSLLLMASLLLGPSGEARNLSREEVQAQQPLGDLVKCLAKLRPRVTKDERSLAPFEVGLALQAGSLSRPWLIAGRAIEIAAKEPDSLVQLKRAALACETELKSGRRAWKRPLDEAEREELATLTAQLGGPDPIEFATLLNDLLVPTASCKGSGADLGVGAVMAVTVGAHAAHCEASDFRSWDVLNLTGGVGIGMGATVGIVVGTDYYVSDRPYGARADEARLIAGFAIWGYNGTMNSGDHGSGVGAGAVFTKEGSLPIRFAKFRLDTFAFRDRLSRL